MDLLREGMTIDVPVFRFDCQTCGHVIEIRQFPGGDMEVLPHYYCDRPTISVVCQHPRKLGVISGRT